MRKGSKIHYVLEILKYYHGNTGSRQRFRNLTASGLFCQPDFFLKDCQDRFPAIAVQSCPNGRFPGG
jgi:hypothetical protein